MIATDEVRRLQREAQFETLITPWTNEDEAEDIAHTTVWNMKSCNLGFVAGKGEVFYKLVKERIQIHNNVKTKAQKTGDVAAARLLAKSTQLQDDPSETVFPSYQFHGIFTFLPHLFQSSMEFGNVQFHQHNYVVMEFKAARIHDNYTLSRNIKKKKNG
jgi:hypothetical protein